MSVHDELRDALLAATGGAVDLDALSTISGDDGNLTIGLGDGSLYALTVSTSQLMGPGAPASTAASEGKVKYVLRTDTDLTFLLADDGHVLSRSDHPGEDLEDADWFIRGATQSHSGKRVIPLDDLARGADAGQAWIVDDYHGERRTWGNHRLRSLRLYDDGEW